MRKHCPHKDVRFCPLYHAAHEGGVFSCDDGHLDTGVCAVGRTMSYDGTIARMRIERPGIVERLEFQEGAEERWEQTKRNMKLLGIN